MTEYSELSQREREIYKAGYDEGFPAGASAALSGTCNSLAEIDSRFEKEGDESPSQRRDRAVEIIRGLLEES